MLEASGYLYMWVLKIGGIQNLIAQSLLKFWNYPFHFLKFLAVELCGLQICWYPNKKHVGTQKCGYYEISNLVGTQNWWQIIRYRYFRVTTQSLKVLEIFNEPSCLGVFKISGYPNVHINMS